MTDLRFFRSDIRVASPPNTAPASVAGYCEACGTYAKHAMRCFTCGFQFSEPADVQPRHGHDRPAAKEL